MEILRGGGPRSNGSPSWVVVALVGSSVAWLTSCESERPPQVGVIRSGDRVELAIRDCRDVDVRAVQFVPQRDGVIDEQAGRAEAAWRIVADPPVDVARIDVGVAPVGFTTETPLAGEVADYPGFIFEVYFGDGRAETTLSMDVWEGTDGTVGFGYWDDIPIDEFFTCDHT